MSQGAAWSVLSTLRAATSQWTCRSCRASQQLSRAARNATRQRLQLTGAPRYASTNTRRPPQRRRRIALLATAGSGLGVSLVAFSDDIKSTYDGTARASRVVSTLGVCVRDYRSTLKQRDAIDDEDERTSMLAACHKRCAERTLKALEKNGGIFIKLGQHLSAMNYLLPIEWTSTFIPLQDKCPVSSIESIRAMFKEDTGHELSDFFDDFSDRPIGAASLAQVHLATLKETGQRVAVKVQHPTLAQWAPLDLTLTRVSFSTLAYFFPEYDLSWLSRELDLSLPQELDFKCEGENAKRTLAYFANMPSLPLVIPDVIWARKRILVMANEAGHRLDDLAYLDSNGIDRDEVSASLARIFNEMIFGEGAPLHCDPHGGNLAIRKNDKRRGGANFDVILYDHGLYRDIPLDLRRSYAKMWLAIIENNMTDMRLYTKEVAGITDEQFPLFASAITGRDFTVVSTSITAPKSAEEKKTMGDALSDGLLADLVQMLGQVPRIILLILKTNDLTRALDESLQTRAGSALSFLILAQYCSRTVFREQMDIIRQHGGFLWPRNMVRLLGASLGYLRIEVKLKAFEWYLTLKRALGLKADIRSI